MAMYNLFRPYSCFRKQKLNRYKFKFTVKAVAVIQRMDGLMLIFFLYNLKELWGMLSHHQKILDGHSSDKDRQHICFSRNNNVYMM
jgi:hypothetical protein